MYELRRRITPAGCIIIAFDGDTPVSYKDFNIQITNGCVNIHMNIEDNYKWFLKFCKKIKKAVSDPAGVLPAFQWRYDTYQGYTKNDKYTVVKYTIDGFTVVKPLPSTATKKEIVNVIDQINQPYETYDYEIVEPLWECVG